MARSPRLRRSWAGTFPSYHPCYTYYEIAEIKEVMGRHGTFPSYHPCYTCYEIAEIKEVMGRLYLR